MTGEQFLNSIRCLDMEIAALDKARWKMEDRRKDLLDKAECLGANLSGSHVQHTIGSRTEDIGVQLADLATPEALAKKLDVYQQRINQKIDTLIDRKDRAQRIIDRLSDARYKALLINRYISNLKWSTVADLMGYTENWVKIELKAQAVAAFERAMKTTT